MKITLVGAAGVRSPLLVHGLAGLSSKVRVDELAFWDTDSERVKITKRVAEAMGKRSELRARLKAYSDPEHALEGAGLRHLRAFVSVESMRESRTKR